MKTKCAGVCVCVCGYEDVVGVHSNVLSAQNRMQESRFMCDVQLGYVVMYIYAFWGM